MDSPFANRRQRLMERMGERAALLLPGATLRPRNGDVFYRFRQDSDFFYLTGYEEPDAVLILSPGRTQKMALFVRPRDPEREIWDGRRAGVEGAVSRFGADEAFAIVELEHRLLSFLENIDTLYFPLGRDSAWDGRILQALDRLRGLERRGVRPPHAVVDPREILGEMRLRKEEVELVALRRAADITASAHEVAMRMAKPGAWEYEVEASIEQVFRGRGAAGAGYTTIVGGGPNATILHYIENSAQLKEGELLLVDAGAEWGGYTADVTRTTPIGGRFRPAARRVYEAVLDAQLESLAAVRPGATLDEIHGKAVEVLVRHLHEMKLVAEPPAESIERGTYKRFYMHRTSHWLGLDVHDAGRYTEGGRARPLEPGFVLTVEPGLYISADAHDLPEEYRGIGVRIEDDVLVTHAGSEVLTAQIPKQVAELERIATR